MNKFLRHRHIKLLSCCLVLTTTGLLLDPDLAHASFIPNQMENISEIEEESLEELKVVLENELIREKLSEVGLNATEISLHMENLSITDREIVLETLFAIQIGGRETLPIEWWFHLAEIVGNWYVKQSGGVKILLFIPIVGFYVIWLFGIPYFILFSLG